MKQFTCSDELLLWHAHYNQIIHSISDENKQFQWKYIQQKHHRITTTCSEWVNLELQDPWVKLQPNISFVLCTHGKFGWDLIQGSSCCTLMIDLGWDPIQGSLCCTLMRDLGWDPIQGSYQYS